MAAAHRVISPEQGSARQREVDDARRNADATSEAQALVDGEEEGLARVGVLGERVVEGDDDRAVESSQRLGLAGTSRPGSLAGRPASARVSHRHLPTRRPLHRRWREADDRAVEVAHLLGPVAVVDEEQEV